MSTLAAFGIIVGFFIIVQWAAASVRESVRHALELFPSLVPNPSSDLLAIEIDRLAAM